MCGKRHRRASLADWLIVAGLVIALIALSGCAVPVDTRGAATQTAGRCKLMTYGEERGHVSFGLIPMAISAYNTNQRRQEIYDACLAAGGGRETPAETLPSAPQ
jgi:hypothetical protein